MATERALRQRQVDETLAALGKEPTIEDGMDFYLLQSNRRRIKEIDHLLSTDPCPTCDGSGRVPKHSDEPKS